MILSKAKIQGVSTIAVFLNTNDGVRRHRKHCRHYISNGGKCALKKKDPWSDKCGNVSRCDRYEEVERETLSSSISSIKKSNQGTATLIKDMYYKPNTEPSPNLSKPGMYDKFYRYKPTIVLDIGEFRLRFEGCFKVDEIKYLVLLCGRKYFIFAKKNIDEFFFFLQPKTKIFKRLIEQICHDEMNVDAQTYRKEAFRICDLLKENGIKFDSLLDYLDVHGKGKDTIFLPDIISSIS